MLNLFKLLGKSPFTPLQEHLKKVTVCVNDLIPLLSAIESNDMELIQKISKQISNSEHEADLVKNDIRNALPKSIFLPIGRAGFLEILSLQDAFADKAEDVAVVSTFKTLENYKDLKEEFEFFYKGNVETFILTKNVLEEFDTLLESSFGGIEAEKVKIMIKELAYKEHELDIAQFSLIKKLYTLTDKMHYSLFYVWTTIIREIGQLSNIGEKLGNHIRMILES